MTVCHVCGTENPEGTKFCEGCGVELSAPASSAAVPDASVVAAPVVAAPIGESPVDIAPMVVEEAFAAPVVAETVAPVVEAAVPTPEVVAPVLEAAPVVVEAMPNVSADAVNPHNTLIEEPLAPAPVVTAPPVSVPVVSGGGIKSARLVPRDYGASTTETFPLVGDRVSIGRFDSSTGPVDIDLSGMKGEVNISRRHAEFVLENDKWVIRDLGSTNGVYLKRVGQSAYSPRIMQPEILNDGDEIAFGNMKFLYTESVEA
jgi:FHA domain